VVPIPDPAPAPPTKSKTRGSWIIQVGAFDTKTEAIQRLSTVQDGLKNLLEHANPITERTEKGDKTMYRARFAGLDRSRAEAACKNLKRSDIPCMLLKD
jgi:D-alanyl-D-alanine carboxypeptidase